MSLLPLRYIKENKKITFWHIISIIIVMLLVVLIILSFLILNELRYIYVPDIIEVENYTLYDIAEDISDIANNVNMIEMML